MRKTIRLRRLLFGGSMKQISEETGIPARTLSLYKRNPLQIPCDRLILIVKAADLSDAEKKEIFE